MKNSNSEYLHSFYDNLYKEKDACGIGLVANIDGKKEYRILDDALSIVERLSHRAGKDASGEVGDGVGVLTQIPHKFFERVAKDYNIHLGNIGDYGIAMIFFPNDDEREKEINLFKNVCKNNGLNILGWRDVPINYKMLGKKAIDCMPKIMQCIVERPNDCEKGIEFDRRLYICRIEFEHKSNKTFINSFSSRTIVYKGMLLVNQLRQFYNDLQDEDFETAIAIVHSRFSTNTLPSWSKAHPYRMIAHNGEINTIRGNFDRMYAREETLHSDKLDNYKEKIYPIIQNVSSDSAMLDNTLEFFVMNGIPLPLAMMMLVPEPWSKDDHMSENKKDFYHYYSTMMEAWDGPAAILFTDGELIGATLDRNGLRPARYYITDDNRLILSSEVGVLDIDDLHIIKKSRLKPGNILLIDVKNGRIISDEECKSYYTNLHPYGEWLSLNLIDLNDVKIPNHKVPIHSEGIRKKLYKIFAYTDDEIKNQILPMARNGVEATASMGHDEPLAVLSEKHPLLFYYFKQLFAEVSNPPIDSIREEIVTDTNTYIGTDGNLLNANGDNCHMLQVDSPILTGIDILKIKTLNDEFLKCDTVSILYNKNTSLDNAINQLVKNIDKVCSEGTNIIILSDRGVDENNLPMPSLLAVSAVEQHLVETKKRMKVSIILESGEPRDVHQMAMLLGFGARAINPYLAHECIEEMIDKGILDKESHEAIDDYNQALLHGVVKTAAKMGISTLQSYQSAKIFEAIGISKDVIDKYFMGIVSRVGGIGINEISEDIIYRHNKAFDEINKIEEMFDNDECLYSKKNIIALQKALRTGDYKLFKEYSSLVNNGSPHTLRNLLTFKETNNSIPLEEVEDAHQIVKRFKTGAMSYGSISKEAHETIAKAMNSLGAKSNTGEGGEDPERFNTDRNSKIKQVASGRFGVTSEYLNNADEIQIKMAQGAKPGEGGHLPGKKVYPWIAERRYSTPGVELISPPPHHDIYSIEDLAELIYDLKNVNRNAKISVKLVSEIGVGTIACGVAKAGADVILISGYDGGTGAAPVSSIHNAGIPLELGLAETQKDLIENGLRNRVAIETDGKLMTGRDVAIAALLGADEFSFATAPLVSLGCMMMRVCNKDTCPFGIATQNEDLRKRFKGKPEYLCNFMLFVAEELREIMAKLGFRNLNEMIGRSDLLKVNDKQNTKRSKLIDMNYFLNDTLTKHNERHFISNQVLNLDNTIDEKHFLPLFEKWDAKDKLNIDNVKISNVDRTVGTILGSSITNKYGSSLEDDSINISFVGSGGQSFGSFIPKGLTMKLTGDANDGFGKGLSGGKLIVKPPNQANYEENESVIIGNVALYGATSGTAYICGVAGERFMVRNSGAIAVCEGCGNHGLEYMTGGKAIILGDVGKNFAAGMSGGVAYILDAKHILYTKTNKSIINIEELNERADIEDLKRILIDYEKCTGSKKAKHILEEFDKHIQYFKKIIPYNYKKIIGIIEKYELEGLSKEDARYKAFKELQNDNN
ncbi:MAG: glutamate synthase large subunit [Lachnospiraceae bacterium]|nr:glutamate synthase large subunit [Lachnospiraceae bacterium]